MKMSPGKQKLFPRFRPYQPAPEEVETADVTLKLNAES